MTIRTIRILFAALALAVFGWAPAASRFRGEPQLPGDKSISHRYAILGAMATGTTRIEGYSDSEDCHFGELISVLRDPMVQAWWDTNT